MARASADTTVMDVIKSVLPDGTRGGSRGWANSPEWPPDLFAAVATITERSGLYSESTFVSYWKSDFHLTEAWIEKVAQIGEQWAETGRPPSEVQRMWKELVGEHANSPIVDPSDRALAWKKTVFWLLSTADEACAGIGFQPPPKTSRYFQKLYLASYLAWVDKRLSNSDQKRMGGDVLPYLPHSLCVRVPPDVLCVQPKTSTPAVGCTLRSLTHHLALLPCIANVSTSWNPALKSDKDRGAFNVLVVPFPFSIPGRSFSCVEGCFPGVNERAFKVNPDVWMRGAQPQQFAEFLLELVKVANAELEPVHAIVLPETALRLRFAEAVAKVLASEPDLDLFVTGVVAGGDGHARNSAAIYRFANGKVIQSSFQSKHHRWCLNEDQIRRYHLGHVLDPHHKWWEQIDVNYRSCYVMLFRPEATLSVLVCEDLARYDPVLTVMNAIGPNLVIALLMDGPQLEQRWPGRYATVLADDPGSSVLTVTSLGMVARSSMPGEQQKREIALWKRPDGQAKALKLPHGDHALLLTLTSRSVEQYTLDGRGDGGQTVRFELGAAHGIRHPDPTPEWLGRVP